ncbi:hypothetical protein RF55_5892 [Lasius niger]|uniref:Uncharacterized protein n=1 Tax=Lasius niger TaxID=67767 RepID=A0A0J7NN88_LASNI|nr:hypothetical protein RF55_5892 [Lasius niger]
MRWGDEWTASRSLASDIDRDEVDDDDAWQEPKSMRQIGGNTVDKEREELDEENLCRSCVNATNAGSDEENERGRERGGKRRGKEKRGRGRRGGKIEEDHEDGCFEWDERRGRRKG